MRLRNLENPAIIKVHFIMGDDLMLYPYMTFADGTEICHTQILEKPQGKTVEVHFERPVENGFCTARCELPGYTWLIREGFSQEELREFETFLRANAHLIFKYAREGGIFCA